MRPVVLPKWDIGFFCLPKWLQAAEFHAANCRNIRVAYKPAGVQCLPGDIA